MWKEKVDVFGFFFLLPMEKCFLSSSFVQFCFVQFSLLCSLQKLISIDVDFRAFAYAVFIIHEHLHFAFSAYFGVFIFILEYVTNVIYTCTFSLVQFSSIFPYLNIFPSRTLLFKESATPLYVLFNRFPSLELTESASRSYCDHTAYLA